LANQPISCGPWNWRETNFSDRQTGIGQDRQKTIIARPLARPSKLFCWFSFSGIIY
jgi:hypothetical protein